MKITPLGRLPKDGVPRSFRVTFSRKAPPHEHHYIAFFGLSHVCEVCGLVEHHKTTLEDF